MKKKLLLISLAIVMLVSGCTMYKHNLTKLEIKEQARVTENNSAAYISSLKTRAAIERANALLNTANVPTNNAPVTLAKTNFFNTELSLGEASRANDLTGSFLERNQNMLGMPAHDQAPVVEDLLSSNRLVQIKAEIIQKVKESQEERWQVKEAEYKQKLENYGMAYETERNDRITKYVKWGSILLVAIGGPIALCVFFPPLLAGVIGFVPQIAGFFRVVPKVAFSSLVKGVGNARNELQVQAKTAKEHETAEPTYTSSEVLALLDEHLEEATKNHRSLIDNVRNQTNV